MYKLGITLALVALLGNMKSSEAMKLRDDLWSDEEETADTLSSIKSAEKIHGVSYKGITKEDEKSLITEKSRMTFNEDEQFVKNDKKTFSSLIQIDSSLNFEYPEPRPIGEMLSLISDGDTFVLHGANLNDEEDETTTLESIRSAESIRGGRMDIPEINRSFYKRTGSKIQNLLENNQRITADILNDAMIDKDQEQKMEEKKQEQKKSVVKIQTKKQAQD